ncbi:Adt-1p, partial [Halocaridina rubra]
LSPNEVLTSPNFVFLARKVDGNELRPTRRDQLSCYYQGVDDSHSETLIAVELCGPVRGVVKSPDAEFVIEPIPDSVGERRRRRRSVEDEIKGEKRNSESIIFPHSHIIYRRRGDFGSLVKHDSRIRRSFITDYQEIREALSSRQGRKPYFDSYEHVLDANLRSEWSKHEFGAREDSERYDTRQRSEDLFIEMAVFVDQDLYKHMEDNFPTNTEEQVLKVVLAMINAVQLLYNDDSLGHRVKFVLKRLEILYTDPPSLRRPYDIDNFLTSFCTWQRSENPSSDTDPLHWDHAVILTGLDVYTITSRGKVNSQVV